MSAMIDLMRVVANWLNQLDEEHGCLPYFPENSLINSKKSVPTISEVSKRLKWHAAQLEHPPFICVYRAVYGWQTALHVWDLDGFYDVFSTGMGPYGHSKKGYDVAVREGRSWAKDEGVEFKKPQKWTKSEK